jgi:hypothetical protein
LLNILATPLISPRLPDVSRGIKFCFVNYAVYTAYYESNMKEDWNYYSFSHAAGF